ncbi:2-oxoacid dehydrogenases acyltransferase-domain-containing protein [Pisolithus marmoratus]|nr:2-oxoacid dehydrogenases acyltransferase-domain-containing protein [Pisolithus marmoratus]
MSSALEAASISQPDAAAPAPALTYSPPPQHSVVSPSSSLYVWELDPTVTEATLFEIFNMIGPVEKVHVIRDKLARHPLGSAIVNYSSTADGQRALQQLNYSKIKNRPCRIRPYQRDYASRKAKSGIHVKNLDEQIDDKARLPYSNGALHDKFVIYGNVFSCKVALDAQGQTKRHGTVHYDAAEAAQKAIDGVNGTCWNGKTVYVSNYKSPKECQEMWAQRADTSANNVGFSVTRQEVEAPLQQIGEDDSDSLSVSSARAVVAKGSDELSDAVQTAPEAAAQPSKPTAKEEPKPSSSSTSKSPKVPVSQCQPQEANPELARNDSMFSPLITKNVVPGQGIPLSAIQSTATNTLLMQYKQELPHHYLAAEINMDEVLKQCEVFNRTLGERRAAELSVNDFILKAVACALANVPEVNSAWLGEVIREYKKADISMAIATRAGWVTSVVKDVGSKGLQTISAEAKALNKKARNGKLAPQECQGGTFTVCNLGMFDIDHFTAVINPLQSCTLAIGSTKLSIVPSLEEERGFKTVNIMKVTLSFDHRVVDGAIGAHWLSAFKGYLEDPSTLILF